MRISNSARLQYDFVSEEDADFLFELDQDEDVMRFISGGKTTTRQEIEQVFLPRLAAYRNATLGWGLWKVSIKTPPFDDIGWILVRPMGFFSSSPDVNNLELGWRFKKAYWGSGYASESAIAVRNAMHVTGVNQFSAIALPSNHASIAVMKKLGMVFSHHQRYVDDVFDEEVVVYTQKCA